MRNKVVLWGGVLLASLAWSGLAGEAGPGSGPVGTDISGAIAMTVEEGLTRDSFQLTNNSALVAEDVTVELTIVRINGDPKAIKEYWGKWNPGETNKITEFSAKAAYNSRYNKIQRVDVRITASACHANRTFLFGK